MIQNYKGRKAMQEARSLLLFEIIRSGLYSYNGQEPIDLDIVLRGYTTARNVPFNRNR